MIIKVLGSGMVILSLFLFGNLLTERLIRHVKYIKEMIEMIEDIKREMRYNNLTVMEMANRLRKNRFWGSVDIFDKLYKEMLKGNTLQESWQRSIRSHEMYKILEREEIEEIEKVGYWLGITEIEGQILKLEMTKEYLKKRLKIAENEKEKYHKLYGKLGLLSGLALVILIW